MGALYYLLHPNQLRSIIQWKVWHNPVHRRDTTSETETLQECFRFLNLTSRSFAAVIQELNPELLVPVTLFYLVLRGLDTIEDDMTIPIEKKVPLLQNFHKTMLIDGWQFHESQEKDRELLEKYDVVVTEMKRIKKAYADIIIDIAEKMGNGMADYAQNADMIQNGVQSVEDYELYCHYVAGLVGEGLTRLFVTSELANPKLLERPTLTESMGQLLQKTNIIRDLHEDWRDGRRWYPKEIWSKHVDQWEHLFDPQHRDQAIHCVSEMILNALGHVEECLFYMAGIREQSVFNFVAIPQTMAIATLELVFRNPTVLQRNIKITKGDACQIMFESTQNLFLVCEIFRKYIRRIQAKNDPRDPNYLAISVRCAKIEQFIETLYPRQNPKNLAVENAQRQKKEPTMDPGETLVLFGIVTLCLLFVSSIMIGMAWFMGARFPIVSDVIRFTKTLFTNQNLNNTRRDEL
ncbi:squalene/phytoene synthase domain-containing protein [Hirsutella rhossiliensis]|uniref:Squalene synthase n=1 Tax=Hirsutella rhossiliensis TaxID=111463 RepID=A0A9P8SIN6_9HYPO|nr:squalene/phytoene synthase domain-containing protein [Hirsutella rhossiliensis]KAH0962196.1 squalene/phytoene synthase domain-containing protein [Hirsutella rhossiliensis]